MAQKGIRGRMCHAVHRHTEANKYKKDYDSNIKSSYLKYWDVKNLEGWTMLQKLPVHNFQWTNDKFNFYENFI